MKRVLDSVRGHGVQRDVRPRTQLPSAGSGVSRVFVGSLAYSTNWQSLKDHFQKAGEVECANVLLKPDGSSKGCGMVNFSSPSAAARAVRDLNESLLDGRHIMVKLDQAGHSGLTGGGRIHASSVQQVQMGHRASIKPVNQQHSHQSRAALPVQRHNIYPERQEGVTLPPEQISRVFVGNLSFTTTWQMLKDHMKPAGDVEFCSVLETPEGRSKGCGMVNFRTHEEALNAVDMLNASTLDTRQITVKLDVDGKFKDRPPPKQLQIQPSPPAEEITFSLPVELISRVFVGNLAFTTNWQALKDHFSQVGEIEFASVLLHADRTSKGCGMVNFLTHDDAVRAVELLNGSELDNRQITVKLDVDGKFKERPPPGARPRVVQRVKHTDTPEQSFQNSIPISRAGSVAVRSVDNVTSTQVAQQALTGLLAQLTQPGAAVGRGTDWLALLTRAMQATGNGQIDWPTLASNMQAAGVSSR